MLTTLITCTMFTLTILLFTAPSPLPLGVLILLLTLTTSLLMAIYTPSWFGMMLFLIYVGGLLVMFIYFAALCPNHYMSLSYILKMTLLGIFLMLTSQQLLFPTFSTFSTLPPPTLNIAAMFFSSNIPALLFLSLLLFLILIAVVTVTHHTSGPLRPFN